MLREAEAAEGQGMGHSLISCWSCHNKLRSTTSCETPHDITYRQAGPWQAVLTPVANCVHPTCTKVRRPAVTNR